MHEKQPSEAQSKESEVACMKLEGSEEPSEGAGGCHTLPMVADAPPLQIMAPKPAVSEPSDLAVHLHACMFALQAFMKELKGKGVNLVCSLHSFAKYCLQFWAEVVCNAFCD